MNRKMTYLLPLLSILVLVLSACGSQPVVGPAGEVEPVSAQEVEQVTDKDVESPSNVQIEVRGEGMEPSGDIQEESPGAQIEPAGAQMEVKAASDDDVGDVDEEGTTVESSQFAQAPGPVVETPGPVDPDEVPSLEEREAMLDGVNLAPEIVESDQFGEPAPPGTESQLGDNPRDDVLDEVNPGGPIIPESPPAPGEGPTLDTESASEGASTIAEAANPSLWNQLVQTVSNWLRTLFN